MNCTYRFIEQCAPHDPTPPKLTYRNINPGDNIPQGQTYIEFDFDRPTMIVNYWGLQPYYYCCVIVPTDNCALSEELTSLYTQIFPGKLALTCYC